MQLSAGLRQEFDNTLVKDRIVCGKAYKEERLEFSTWGRTPESSTKQCPTNQAVDSQSPTNQAQKSVSSMYRTLARGFCKMNPPRGEPRGITKRGFAPMPAGGIHLRSKLRRTVPSRLDIH